MSRTGRTVVTSEDPLLPGEEGVAEPWLAADEMEAWRAFLAMRRALARGVDLQLRLDAQLSEADYALLVPLSEAAEGRLRARDLSTAVDWERSRLSHQIRRMEERGLVVRTGCPTDARGTMVELTALGRSTIESAAPGHAAWVREHFVGLLTPSELSMLTEICERVVERLAAEHGPCPDGAVPCDSDPDAPW